ncbi:MAG: hypothetical protein E2O39_12985 [Planctomycetota bacterium]|nr:MAG: hypothetical protein E2O39_12985 [Planctomycetota bacterium]
MQSEPHADSSAVPAILICGGVLPGSGSQCANRRPLAETFPSIDGQTLSGDPVRIPEDFTTGALVVIGYVKESAEDVSHWLSALENAGFSVPARSYPKIRGWLPRIFRSKHAVRLGRGVPDEDPSSVVTLYAEAEVIGRFTGTEHPQHARLLLLDERGRVTWFHDSGFSGEATRSLEGQNRKQMSDSSPSRDLGPAV